MEAQANAGQSDVGTTTEASLSVPRGIHTKERPHKCNVCGRYFIQNSDLHKHMMTHTGERPHGCKICSKTFLRSGHLVEHMRTHTGEKPFQCEYCKKWFSVKSSLNVHRRIHTKERPYKCNVCERDFIQNSDLHKHMRIHTGERPHGCKICSKTFITSTGLTIHMRTHTGEKPFQCEYCKKSFSQKSTFSMHRRIHTKEHRYKCNVCGRDFVQRCNLHRHMRMHTGERPQEYNSKKALEIHIKTQSDSMFRSSPVDSAVNLSLNMNCISNNSCSSNSDTSNAAVRGSGNEMIPGYGYGNREQQESVSNHCATIPDLQLEGVFAGGKVEAGLEALEEEYRRPEFFGSVEPEPLIFAPTSSVMVTTASPPNPRDIVASTVTREAISLPPKKRYKMILESMQETERNEKLAAQ